MKPEIPVQDSASLVKDLRSGAVLSIDRNGLAARRRERERNKKLNMLPDEVESLRGEVEILRKELEKLRAEFLEQVLNGSGTI